MEKKTAVLYPGLSVSHFVPMMRLAGPLLDHGYAVSVALIDTGVKQDIAFGAVVRRVAASMPSVRFHTLPAVEDLPKLAQDGQFVLTYLHLVSRYNERLHDFLRSMRVHAVVVRAPASDDPEKPHDPSADPDLNALMPDGFMERTNGRGLVVKLWAPQVDVLRHRATGAFVTHCGWNSVLEGVTAGVPMLCWPLYSEQKMNKVHMVGNMGIAAEMVGWQQGLVKAGEVDLVMESKEGRELRARAVAYSEAAAVACNDGGSSRLALAQFLADVASRQDRACSEEVIHRSG